MPSRVTARTRLDDAGLDMASLDRGVYVELEPN